MAQTLLISAQDVREELGAVTPQSAMGAYLRVWGDESAQNRVLEKRILEAQQNLETRLQIYLFHTRILTTPFEDGKTRGEDYDVITDGYPYKRADFSKYGTVILRKRPVFEIHRAGLRYGNTRQNLAAADFPQGWVNSQARLGVLHILPILGMGGQISAGSLLLLPLVSGMTMGSVSVPLIFSIDYTAGYLPRSFDPETQNAVEECADYDLSAHVKAVKASVCASVLRATRRAVAPGGGSISMDGFGQSWGDGRFASEIEDYEKQAETQIALVEGGFPLPIFAL